MPTDQNTTKAFEQDGPRSRAATWFRRGAGIALTLTTLAFIAILALPPALGYQRFIITGGSMTGSIDKGSVAFARSVPVKELEVGDVITYTPPGFEEKGPVTHRIVWAGRDGQGLRAFKTKGDANATRDPWTFTLDQKTQARVEWSVPFAGYAMAAMSIPTVRMIVLVLAALAFAAGTLRRLWKEAGEELRGKRETRVLIPPPQEQP